jgi:hypothetical protein
MRALHIVKENPSKNSEYPVISESKLEIAYLKLTEYLEQVKETKGQIGFEAHEAAVTRLVYTLGQAALSDVLTHYDTKTDVISVGDQTYRRKHKAIKTYQTGLGPVEINRHIYVNRKKDGDGRAICSLELQAGIIEGYWTPMAAKNSMWGLAHLTAHEVEDMLLQFGKMNPSRSSLDRLPKALNQHWEPQTIAYHDALIDSESIPKNARSVAVSLDGVMVGMKPQKSATEKPASMKTEWKEASCGTVSFFGAEGARLSTIQYGRMPEHKKATLKTILRKHTEAILQQRPELKVVHLADGAQDNWTFFDEDMPLGFQLTDFYHASEHLKAALDAAYPKNQGKSRLKFEYYKIVLRDELGGINKVLRALRHLRNQHKGNAVIAANVTYFTNNQHRMKYAEAKNNNYPIGSGIVEASCKTLVGQRLKRSGMSWQHNGGQGVLTFRSLIKSQRFDKAWEIIATHYKKTVIENKNVINLVVQN